MKRAIKSAFLLGVSLLASLTVHPARAQSFTRFVDPIEHSFTVDVPAGWQVHGGMVRYGPLSIAPVLQALAPDGGVFVLLGDSKLKDYEAPMPGFQPGQLYTPGTSIFIIRVPEDGPGYARSYAAEFAGQTGCVGLREVRLEPVPNPPGSVLGVGSTTSGEESFTCQKNGRAYAGKVLAATRITRIPPMGNIGWSVVYLASFIARDDQAQPAEQIWDRMRNSFAFTPEWNQLESQIAAGAVRPAMHQLDQTLDLARKFDQQVLDGSVGVSDPSRGTQSEAPIGPAPYYYADGLGHTVNSYDPNPPPGYHAVKPQW